MFNIIGSSPFGIILVCGIDVDGGDGIGVGGVGGITVTETFRLLTGAPNALDNAPEVAP